MASPTPTWILIFILISHTSLTLAINSVPATISPEGELYDSLALENFYVDKTLMIEEFFTCLPENEFHLIAQPPKFGKTTVLKMIKRFVEVELDDHGYVPREKNCTTAQILFERFRIARNKDIMKHHLAQYPVIYVDFNFEDSGWLPSKDRALASLREKISICYKRYYWLYDHLLRTHPHVDMDDVEFMKKAIDGTLSQRELARSLQKLAELLHSYFREKVIVLVDDYDKSIINATFKPASWKSYAFNALSLSDLIFKILYNVLYEARAHVRHALITGVSTMAAESTSIKVNTLARWSFLDEHYFNQYYGFTQFEVNELLDKYQVDENDRSLVRIYYKNGFHIIEPYTKRLYRPESIVSYLRSKLNDSRTAFRSYWNETEISSFRVQFLNNRQLRQKLIMNMANRSAGVILSPFQDPRVSQNPICDLIKLTCQKFQNFNATQSATVARYLFESGFLYYDSITNFFYIANLETEKICVRKIHQYYREIVQIDNLQSIGSHLVSILNDVTNQDQDVMQKFKIELQEAFQKNFNYSTDLTSINHDYDPPREFMDLECQSMVFMMAKLQPEVIVEGKITKQSDSIETIMLNKDDHGMIIRTKYKASLAQDGEKFVHHYLLMKKILTIYVDEKFQVQIDLQNVQPPKIKR